MPDSMLGAFREALAALRNIGWTVATEGNGTGEGPFLELPPDVETAFDADGELTRSLQFTWRGVAADAQVAFAATGLILVIPLLEDSGVATVLPHGTPERDLQVILRLFEDLRRIGYFAEPALAFTMTDSWQAARSRSDGRKVLFWTTQDHEDAFDEETDLVQDLPLYWTGDRQEIADVLAATELVVRIPDTDEEIFYLAPHTVDD